MKRSKGMLLPVALSTLASVKSPVQAASDMFMKVSGIAGESLDKQHKDEIDILAWSWQLSRPVGGTSGEPVIRPISIIKQIDKSSPALYDQLLTGTPIQEVVLSARSVGDTPIEYLHVTMTNALVVNVATGGSASDDGVTEQLSFTYETVTMEYIPQNPDGSPGTPVEASWDLTSNSPQ